MGHWPIESSNLSLSANAFWRGLQEVLCIRNPSMSGKPLKRSLLASRVFYCADLVRTVCVESALSSQIR